MQNTCTMESGTEVHRLFDVLLLLLFSDYVVSDPVTPWTAAHKASLSFTVSWSLLKLMSIESVMLFNHLILCHSVFLLPSIFPFQKTQNKTKQNKTKPLKSGSFQWVSSLHQVAKVLEFQLQHPPFQ